MTTENQYYVMTEEVVNDMTCDPQALITEGTSAQGVMDSVAKNVVYDYLSVKECPDAEEKADPDYEPESYQVNASVYPMRQIMTDEQVQDFHDEIASIDIDNFVDFNSYLVAETYDINDLPQEQQDEVNCDKIEERMRIQQANWQASQDAS